MKLANHNCRPSGAVSDSANAKDTYEGQGRQNMDVQFPENLSCENLARLWIEEFRRHRLLGGHQAEDASAAGGKMKRFAGSTLQCFPQSERDSTSNVFIENLRVREHHKEVGEWYSA